MKFLPGKRAVLVLLAVVLMAAPAMATTTQFTGTGSFDLLPVSATAIFTTGLDTLSIDVYNNIADPTGVIQCLSDLGFVLSSGQTVGAITSSSGIERLIAADGKYGNTDGVDNQWALINGFSFGVSVTGMKLNGLAGTPLDGPARTIIGQDNASGSGVYTGNNSITGNGPHNPFLFGNATTPVHFALSVPGVTAADFVNFAQFSFGTTAGNDVNVPIPPSALLMGSGLLGLGLVGWRRRKKA